MVATAKMAVMLYGGIGGWLGIALAVYLYRIRHDPAHPATVLGVFAMGFTMLMGTMLIGDVFSPYGPHAPIIAIWFTYTLLIVSELALVGTHTHPHVFEDIKRWFSEPPRFAHGRQREQARGPYEPRRQVTLGELDADDTDQHQHDDPNGDA